jgi:ribosomal protein L36
MVVLRASLVNVVLPLPDEGCPACKLVRRKTGMGRRRVYANPISVL